MECSAVSPELNPIEHLWELGMVEGLALAWWRDQPRDVNWFVTNRGLGMA